MCLVWKIIGFDKHSNPGPKHLGSFECKNCAIFSALVETGIAVFNDPLVFTLVACQMIKSFAEVAYLVGFLVRIVHKSNL